MYETVCENAVNTNYTTWRDSHMQMSYNTWCDRHVKINYTKGNSIFTIRNVLFGTGCFGWTIYTQHNYILNFDTSRDKASGVGTHNYVKPNKWSDCYTEQ